MADRSLELTQRGGDLDREANLPLIAVVAVHGVADQTPNESARQVAELLLRQRYAGDAARYTSFREYPLRIPVDPAISGGASALPAQKNKPGPLVDPGNESVDLDLTRELLRHYDSDRSPYDTVRLEGHRLREPSDTDEGANWIARDQCHVHVYEMYWADLSRLGKGIVGILGAIFQLISSLAQLGKRTIEYARLAEDPERKSRRWSAYLSFHRFAVWLLTVVVPLLNLSILGVAIAVPVSRLPWRVQAGALAFVTTLAPLVVRTYRRLRRRRAGFFHGDGPSPWWLVLWLLVGIFVYWALTERLAATVSMQLAVALWIALQAAGLIFLAALYDDRIDTSSRVGTVVTIVSSVALLVLVWQANDVVDMAHGVVRVIEELFIVLAVSWTALMGTGMLAGLAALVVLRRPAAVVTRPKRAIWTATTTLAVSTASLSTLTIFAWSALYATIGPSLPAPVAPLVGPSAATVIDTSLAPPRQRTITPDTSYAYSPLVEQVLIARPAERACFRRSVELPPDSGVIVCDMLSLKSMLRTLLSVSATTGLLLNVVALLLTGAIALWLALPSVILEVRPRREKEPHPERTVALGTWLTAGFRRLRHVTLASYVLIFGGTGMVIALGVRLWSSRMAGIAASIFDFLQIRSDAFVFGVGSAVAASTVGVFALLSRFESVSRVLRPALDISLDVDNYLKERPEKRTPRARMMERFVSLLRYLVQWRRDGAGYDAIIFVAHSQGTVLASETLRYHAQRGFDNVPHTSAYSWQDGKGTVRESRLHIDLLTMGSPLRQLYASSFPDLFAWAEGQRPSDPPPIEPAAFGLRYWLNVFRSGDYVGRSLWHDEDDLKIYQPGTWLAAGDFRRESCLGEGAHTHYWNVYANDVGAVLDQMIVVANTASPRASAQGSPTDKPPPPRQA